MDCKERTYQPYGSSDGLHVAEWSHQILLKEQARSRFFKIERNGAVTIVAVTTNKQPQRIVDRFSRLKSIESATIRYCGSSLREKRKEKTRITISWNSKRNLRHCYRFLFLFPLFTVNVQTSPSKRHDPRHQCRTYWNDRLLGSYFHQWATFRRARPTHKKCTYDCRGREAEQHRRSRGTLHHSWAIWHRRAISWNPPYRLPLARTWRRRECHRWLGAKIHCKWAHRGRNTKRQTTWFQVGNRTMSDWDSRLLLLRHQRPWNTEVRAWHPHQWYPLTWLEMSVPEEDNRTGCKEREPKTFCEHLMLTWTWERKATMKSTTKPEEEYQEERNEWTQTIYEQWVSFPKQQPSFCCGRNGMSWWANHKRLVGIRSESCVSDGGRKFKGRDSQH